MAHLKHLKSPVLKKVEKQLMFGGASIHAQYRW
jgi:hypothetical protein